MHRRAGTLEWTAGAHWSDPHCTVTERLAWVKLDAEIIAKEFAYPCMLRYRGEALVEEVLESVVVSTNDEGMCP
jgi:hypothetical protein